MEKPSPNFFCFSLRRCPLVSNNDNVKSQSRICHSKSKLNNFCPSTVLQNQVVAQGERSLSLSLGTKGLHLTLADRATKEFLWEHLRKMREQAREQAKASRLTRASSIDHINIGDDIKR